MARGILMAAPIAVALLAAAVGCEPSTPPAPYKSDAQGEPARIRVLHVLIAFRGAERAEPKVTRTQEEAEVLAREVLARARRGEDFQKLMKDHSNDHGTGNYSLVNFGVPARTGDSRRVEFAAGFCDVAFALKVGEIGLAPYDGKIEKGKGRCPFGYHVIKRIE